MSERKELRCLIAALYGKSYKRKNVVVHGAADDDDLAKRCAYYGNASLKVKDLKEGFERDKDIFVFAAMLNDGIFHNKELRKEFEEECLNGSHTGRYQRRLEQVKKRWQWFDTRPVAEWMIDRVKEQKTDRLLGHIEALQTATKKLDLIARWLPFAVGALVALAFFR